MGTTSVLLFKSSGESPSTRRRSLFFSSLDQRHGSEKAKASVAPWRKGSELARGTCIYQMTKKKKRPWKEMRWTRQPSLKKQELNGIVTTVVDGGIPCPRCKHTTQLRKRVTLGTRQREAPYYYSQWYVCTRNRKECKTTYIMLKEHQVWRVRETLDSQ